jgi:hypothetical protein
MHNVPEEQTSTYARQLLSARRVADRYSIHIRSIARWVVRGVIPQPDETICGRRYWYAASLDAADRRRTVEAGKAITASNHTSP